MISLLVLIPCTGSRLPAVAAAANFATDVRRNESDYLASESVVTWNDLALRAWSDDPRGAIVKNAATMRHPTDG
jgi:hypothetical protein